MTTVKFFLSAMEINQTYLGLGYEPTYVNSGRYQLTIYQRKSDGHIMITPDMDSWDDPNYKIWLDRQLDDFRAGLDLSVHPPEKGGSSL